MNAEIWKPCVGFENFYEVSDLGRVRRTGKDVLAFKKHSGGYVMVCLHVNRPAYRTVHSLVCEAFIGPRPEGAEINHRDANKQNNYPSNLEYVTHAENMRHAVENGLNGHAPRRYPDVKQCVECNADFKPNPRKRKRHKCCSPDCAQAIRVRAALRARGCAVVPQVAEVVLRAILQADAAPASGADAAAASPGLAEGGGK